VCACIIAFTGEMVTSEKVKSIVTAIRSRIVDFIFYPSLIHVAMWLCLSNRKDFWFVKLCVGAVIFELQ